jgi:hypothetical protein
MILTGDFIHSEIIKYKSLTYIDCHDVGCYPLSWEVRVILGEPNDHASMHASSFGFSWWFIITFQNLMIMVVVKKKTYQSKNDAGSWIFSGQTISENAPFEI